MRDPARRRSDGTMSPSLTQNGSSEARGSILELSGIPMLHRKGARPAAHSREGDNEPLYLDHPQFEGFEVRQTVGRGKVA
jgi:hypothetical protein